MVAQRPHFEHLKRKWTARHRKLSETLWRKHKGALTWVSEQLTPQAIAAGSLGGLLLLAPSAKPLLPPPNLLAATSEFAATLPKSTFVVSDLVNVLPKAVQPLTSSEEQQVAEILSRTFGFTVAAELEGKRLNRSFGIIGAEQHLSRYPGDSMATHFTTQEEASQFFSSGMAPGLSAWGYFAEAKDAMTEQEKLREKYYIAVQTFLAPDFNSRFAEYRDFFKYRKMLVVNPQNGKAVVVVIGDAGPATWTGKHLGGSPEVMAHLERVDGPARGPVLYFFIDDPGDKVPLGPIGAYNKVA